MRIDLDYTKSVEQNAAVYFERSKTLKRKMEGARLAVAKARAELERLDAQAQKEERRLAAQPKAVRRKRDWFEKFRWFYTSGGFLVIGGRDATTNEIVVKKHAQQGDFVFHTDMAGSPFFVLKSQGAQPKDVDLLECADATCSFSRAFKLGLMTSDVFWVRPDQLSKTAKAGEYLTKGSFIVSGKSNYLQNEVNLAVGPLEDGRMMCAPLSAVKAHCAKYLIVKQGSLKPSDAAKKVRKELSAGELDEIISVLPSGNMDIRKQASR